VVYHNRLDVVHVPAIGMLKVSQPLSPQRMVKDSYALLRGWEGWASVHDLQRVEDKRRLEALAGSMKPMNT
jgi:hypothetical protein